jgi:3-oxoacyl-[acyl-carrier protein] reductase
VRDIKVETSCSLSSLEDPSSLTVISQASVCDNVGMDDLKGRVALVTGGSRGIGAGAATALAAAGCDVAVNYRNRREDAERVCGEIRKLGRRAIAIQADVSQSNAVRQMAQQVSQELGTVSVLVNNAGIARQQKIEDIAEADWDELIAVNLKSAFLVTQAFLPAMREQRWGRIIYMSSVAAQTGGVVGPHYAASKAGMLGLTHSLANLLAKEGVAVNAIAPALIATEMVTSNLQASPGKIPVGHFGGVEDVSSIVVMLARNGYITGQTINVNGGWHPS